MVPVNLLPWREQRLQRQWRSWRLLLLALLLGALTALLPGYWQRQLNRQQMVVLAEWGPALRQAAALKARTLAAEQTLQALRDRQRQQRVALRYLQQWRALAGELARSIPPQVWLTEIRTTPGGMVLNGVSRAVADLHQFSQQLRRSPLVVRVQSGGLVRKAENAVHFSLQLQLAEVAGD